MRPICDRGTLHRFRKLDCAKKIFGTFDGDSCNHDAVGMATNIPFEFKLDHAVNWEAISAIGQIVGAIAVVISLIYLGSEVRSNARATRRAAVRSMWDAFNRCIQQLTEHPHLSEVYYRGIHDFEALEGADLVRFSAVMNQLFRVYEEMYYHQLDGHMDSRAWNGVEAACATSMAILEFRPGGVHARIGSVRSLQSSLISDSR
jgi:hypothetical protein